MASIGQGTIPVLPGPVDDGQRIPCGIAPKGHVAVHFHSGFGRARMRFNLRIWIGDSHKRDCVIELLISF